MPDFFLIGAMKAGSTTVWGHLASHPGIFMCRPKEPQFWSRDAARARGLEWYRSLFCEADTSQLCGEASTCYSRWPHFGDVAGQIAKHLPQARFVYILRHPVERCYSHYLHVMDERVIFGEECILSFDAAVQQIPEIVDASLYRMQIERFLAHYPRSAFHVMTLNELEAEPAATWQALQDFLGVERVPLDATRAGVVDNRSGDRLIRVSTRQAIQRLGGASLPRSVSGLLPRPWRERMFARLEGSSLAREFQRRRLEAHRARLSPMSSEMRTRLLQRFRQPTKELEELLCRRFPEWFD